MTQNGFSVPTLCPVVSNNLPISGMLFYGLKAMGNIWSCADPATEPIYYFTINNRVKVLKVLVLLQTVVLQMALLPSGYSRLLYAVRSKVSIIYMLFAVHLLFIVACIDDMVNGELYFNNQIAALRENRANHIRLSYVFSMVFFISFIFLLLLLSAACFLLFPGIINDERSDYDKERYRGHIVNSICGFFIHVVCVLSALIIAMHRV